MLVAVGIVWIVTLFLKETWPYGISLYGIAEKVVVLYLPRLVVGRELESNQMDSPIFSVVWKIFIRALCLAFADILLHLFQNAIWQHSTYC